MSLSSGRPTPRLACLAPFIVVLVAGLPLPAAADGRPHARPSRPPRALVIDALRAVVDDHGRSGVIERDDAIDTPPPASAPVGTTWMHLESQVAALQQLVDARPPARALGQLRRALRAASAAHDALVRPVPDFGVALGDTRAAVTHLVQARRKTTARDTLAAIDAVLDRLADVGARMSADGLERARRGGLSGDRLDAAARSRAEGLALASRGEYVLAFDQFGPGVLVGNLPRFDLDRYEQNIRDTFGGETIGYQYAIAHNGLLVRASANGDTGAARTSDDNPVTPQWAYKEMNIASISKTITATVLLQLLDERGISDNTPIAAWLPPDWTIGPGVDTLTFRQLLQHRSGLNANANGPYELDDLEAYVAAGINAADKTFVYQNANFALFRVAIPYLRYGHAVMALVESLLGLFTDRATIVAGLYKDVVRNYAFAPTGFVEADCRADDDTPTRLYAYPPAGGPGFANGDWTPKCGSGGWFMSSVELVGFMAHRRFGSMISDDARALMDSRYLGWMAPQNYDFVTGIYGIYRAHGGDLTYTDVVPNRGLDTCIMEYPNGVQTALLINSIGGAYSYQCAELTAAYDNAFIVP